MKDVIESVRLRCYDRDREGEPPTRLFRGTGSKDGRTAPSRLIKEDRL